MAVSDYGTWKLEQPSFLYKGTKIWAHCVKCRKIAEVTLGTLDIKSGPMRCWKGLQLQPMCCTPFRLLSQDFRMRRWSTGDQRIRVEDQSCSQSRTLEDENQEGDLFNIQTEVSTWQVQGIYTKYWNKQKDKLENNKQTKFIWNTKYLWRTRSSLYSEL